MLLAMLPMQMVHAGDIHVSHFRYSGPYLLKMPVMVDSIGGPSVLQGMIDNCPCKRVGQPEDIAGAALFLASDDCTFLTGQIIKVDGGFEC